MGNDQSAHHALSSNSPVALRILGNILVALVGESKDHLFCFMAPRLSCQENGGDLVLCRAYVEELEERVKRMDEQLQLLSRGGKLSEQSIEDSQPSGLAADMTRTSGVSNSELLTEGNISATTWSPDDEASLPDQEISDQPSYVLRAQDGKMRFFGWFFLITPGDSRVDSVI